MGMADLDWMELYLVVVSSEHQNFLVQGWMVARWMLHYLMNVTSAGESHGQRFVSDVMV